MGKPSRSSGIDRRHRRVFAPESILRQVRIHFLPHYVDRVARKMKRATLVGGTEISSVLYCTVYRSLFSFTVITSLVFAKRLQYHLRSFQSQFISRIAFRSILCQSYREHLLAPSRFLIYRRFKRETFVSRRSASRFLDLLLSLRLSNDYIKHTISRVQLFS